MVKLTTKMKKNLSLGHFVIAIVGLMLVFYYADKLAIEETVNLVLSQYTEMQDGKCVYYDGIDTCEVAMDQCLESGKYTISMGLCDNLQIPAERASRAGVGWFVGVESPDEVRIVQPGARIRLQGSIRAEASGKFLIEAGLEEYEELFNRQAVLKLPVQFNSFCDGIEYFASGEITQVRDGDIIQFDLQPKVPTKPGTYHYKVYIGNGCYKDLGADATIFGSSDLITVKATGEAIPVDDIDDEEEDAEDKITQDLWEDIKSDFTWVTDIKGDFQIKYVMYGLIILGIILAILIVVFSFKTPKQPQQQQALVRR
jgi:hypothetical protein